MLRVVFVLRSTEVYPVLFRFVGRVLLLLLSSSISFPCSGFLRLGPRSCNPGAALLPGAAFHRLGPTKRDATQGRQPQRSGGEAVLIKKEERETTARRPDISLTTCPLSPNPRRKASALTHPTGGGKGGGGGRKRGERADPRKKPGEGRRPEQFGRRSRPSNKEQTKTKTKKTKTKKR